MRTFDKEAFNKLASAISQIEMLAQTAAGIRAGMAAASEIMGAVDAAQEDAAKAKAELDNAKKDLADVQAEAAKLREDMAKLAAQKLEALRKAAVAFESLR